MLSFLNQTLRLIDGNKSLEIRLEGDDLLPFMSYSFSTNAIVLLFLLENRSI